MPRESAVWKWLDKNRPDSLAIERIEVLYPPGLADTFWTDTTTGISGWWELKSCKPGDEELRAGRIPKIRNEQPLFLTRQARNGVPAGILLRVDDGPWFVFRATGDPAWSNLVRSNQALVNGIKLFDPSVSELLHLFTRKL